MNRLEQTITKIDARLPKEEQRSAFKEIFEWLGTTTDVPPNSYTREWARELLAAIGAMAPYDKYEGSPDTFIVYPAHLPTRDPVGMDRRDIPLHLVVRRGWVDRSGTL